MKLCLIFIAHLVACLATYAQTYDVTEVSFGRSNIGLQLDSIKSSFSRKTDSLTQAYRSPLHRLDSLRSSFKGTLDTMYSNNIEGSRIRRAIDSLNHLKDKTIAQLNNELESIKQNTVRELKHKIDELGLPTDVTEKISKFSAEIEKFSFPTGDTDLARIVPATDLPGELKELNLTTSVPRLTDGKNLVGDVAPNLQIPEVVNAHAAEIQQLAKGDPDAINKIALTAEQKAADLSGLTEIQKEAGSLDKYSLELAKLQDPAALKEQGVEVLQQAAMDHFAGKQQVIQEAMDKMSKYKEKYESLPSLSDVPFKRPNEMRGKPWFERVVPAFMIQIQKEGDNLLVDLNPYVGYRFTGKLTAGPGWNQRIAYDTDGNQFTSKPRIYGPRFFAEYNLWKGFHPRVEVEVMNAYVSPLTKPATIDQGSREWVWGVFVGVKKEYKFLKNVKGTVLIMTRLFDPKHKSPYGDVINARFGFEFPMKKKVKKVGSN